MKHGLMILVFCVMALVFGAAGCGSDDDGSSSCDKACAKMEECGMLKGQPCKCESDCVNNCIINASCTEIQTSASSYINCVTGCQK